MDAVDDQSDGENKDIKKKEVKKPKTKEFSECEMHDIVCKFLDEIVADDTSIGKGTDNMTCTLVRLKWILNKE